MTDLAGVTFAMRLASIVYEVGKWFHDFACRALTIYDDDVVNDELIKNLT